MRRLAGIGLVLLLVLLTISFLVLKHLADLELVDEAHDRQVVHQQIHHELDHLFNRVQLSLFSAQNPPVAAPAQPADLSSWMTQWPHLRELALLDPGSGVQLWQAMANGDSGAAGAGCLSRLREFHAQSPAAGPTVCFDPDRASIEMLWPVAGSDRMLGLLYGVVDWHMLARNVLPAWVVDEYRVDLARAGPGTGDADPRTVVAFTDDVVARDHLVVDRVHAWMPPWPVVVLLIVLLTLALLLLLVMRRFSSSMLTRLSLIGRMRRALRIIHAMERASTGLLDEKPLKEITDALLADALTLVHGKVGAIFSYEESHAIPLQEAVCNGGAPEAQVDELLERFLARIGLVSTSVMVSLLDLKYESLFPIMRKLRLRYLVAVPAIRSERVEGLIVVAGKSPVPDDQALEMLERLSKPLAAIFRRNHELQLISDSEARFRKLFERIADCALIHDLHGRILLANDQAVRITGYPADELVDMRLSELFESRQGELTEMWFDLQNGVSITATGKCRRRGGARFPAELKTVLIDSGEQPEALTLLVDLTERRQQEKQIRSWGVRHAIVADLGVSALSNRGYRETLDTGLALLVQALGGRCGMLLIYDSETAGYRRAAVYRRDHGKELPTWLSAEEVSSWFALLGHSRAGIFLPDRLPRLPDLFGAQGLRSAMLAKLTVHKSRSAVLGVFSEAREWSEDDMHFLTSVGGVFSNAISRHHWEHTLAEQRRFLQSVIDTIPERIMVVDADYRTTLVNRPRGGSLPGRLDSTLFAGMPCYKVLYGFDSPCREPDHACPLSQVFALKESVQVLHHHRMGDEDLVFEVELTPLYDGEEEVHNVIHTLRDVTERERARQELLDKEQRMKHMAHHDNLTGLPNRLRLFQELEQALANARQQDRKVAVLFLDLDRFKQVNDTFGHEAGDELLRVVSARLRDCVRQGDTVARLGGDEFAVVLHALSSADEAGDVADKIIGQVVLPVPIHGQEVQVGTSIGISLFPDDGSDAEDLLKQADDAMYLSKQKGRGGYEFVTRELNALADRQRLLEQRLRRAVDEAEFEVHYQPVVRLADRRWLGVEALLRWRDPEQGLIGPDEFIGVAEETGVIVGIGEQTVSQVAADYATWREAGLPEIELSVNLSLRQFRHQDLVGMLQRRLLAHRPKPGRLYIELTEATISAYGENGISTLRDLRAQGVHLTIDDAGSAQLPYQIFSQVGFDRIKIDRSLVLRMMEDDYAAVVVRTLIDFAGSIKLEVVAEGIESEAHRQQLLEWGCATGQGFLFSKPVPMAELVARVRADQGLMID